MSSLIAILQFNSIFVCVCKSGRNKKRKFLSFPLSYTSIFIKIQRVQLGIDLRIESFRPFIVEIFTTKSLNFDGF